MAMQSRIATRSTMSDVVLDANVLVGLLDEHDALHARAVTLLETMQQEGNRPIMLDIMLTEMVSALCRRGAQRKTKPPDLEHVRARIHAWIDAGLVTFVHSAVAERFERILDIAVASRGILNFNDSALVLLQRDGAIGAVASFDGNLANTEEFNCIGA